MHDTIKLKFTNFILSANVSFLCVSARNTLLNSFDIKQMLVFYLDTTNKIQCKDKMKIVEKLIKNQINHFIRRLEHRFIFGCWSFCLVFFFLYVDAKERCEINNNLYSQFKQY